MITKEQRTAAKKFVDEDCADLAIFRGDRDIFAMRLAGLLDRASRPYEEVLADHRRLVRELDVLINGEAGAAMQASLCDIVGQLKKEKRNCQDLVRVWIRDTKTEEKRNV